MTSVPHVASRSERDHGRDRCGVLGDVVAWCAGGPTVTAIPVLATRSLSKDYGPIRVVADVTLDFHAGSIHALLGENGAG